MNKTTTKPGFSAFDTETDCDAGYELELLDKLGNPSGLFISLLGKNSRVARAKARAKQNERIRKAQFEQRQGRKAAEVTAEDLEEFGVEALVFCTTGWRVDEAKFGPVDPYTPEAAAELYRTSRLVFEQVDQAVSDLSNFIKG